MYELYKNGDRVDGFNPIPDYWIEEISDEERESYKGNAETVSKYIPSVKPEDIERYLVTWDLEADEDPKAYPSDEYPQGDEWQMLDFMNKLHLPYPLDGAGKPLGQIYRFVIPPPKRN